MSLSDVKVPGDPAWQLPLMLPDEAAGGADELLQRLRDGLDQGAPWVGVETDGIRLVKDHAFALGLRRLDARVQLRIAGCSERVHLAVHGRDLRRLQRRALDTCAALGLSVGLVMAVEAGLNDAELGDLALLGLEHPAVDAAMFRAGRTSPSGFTAFPIPRPAAGQPGVVHHQTLSPARPPLVVEDLVHRLLLQLPGMLRPDHFTGTNGCRVAYLVPDGEELVAIDPAYAEARTPAHHAQWLPASTPPRAGASVPFRPAATATRLAASLVTPPPIRPFAIVIQEWTSLSFVPAT